MKLKKRKITGFTVWEGLSPFTDTPIAAIITLKSSIEKTGNIPQVAIIDAGEIPPHILVEFNEDQSVCGTCPHAGGQGCYVQTYRAPFQIWKAYRAGKYPPLPLAWRTERKIRLGSYGDPAAIPLDILAALSARSASGVLGYTHAWRTCSPEYSRYCMASVDNPREREQAHKLGYRTFRIMPSTVDYKDRLSGEAVCAYASAGVSCRHCGACCGSGKGWQGDIVIKAHGARKNRLRIAA